MKHPVSPRHRTLLFLCILSVSPTPAVGTAWAGDFDYRLGADGRSMPFGASVGAEVGYDQLLWGQRGGDEDVYYGFARIAAKGNTAAVVWSGEGMLTLAPVSFFAVDLGATQRLRMTTDYATVSCAGARCEGWVTGRYARARLSLGAAGFFLSGSYKRELQEADLTDRPYVDENTSLTGAAGGDTLIEKALIAGYSWSPLWSVGLAWVSSRLQAFDSSNATSVAYARYGSKDDWRITFGGGTYQSSTQPTSPTVFLSLEWIGKHSYELD